MIVMWVGVEEWEGRERGRETNTDAVASVGDQVVEASAANAGDPRFKSWWGAGIARW